MKSESWIQVLVLHWVCFLEVLLLLLSLINERGGIYLFAIFIIYLLYLYTYVHGEAEKENIQPSHAFVNQIKMYCAH